MSWTNDIISLNNITSPDESKREALSYIEYG